MRNLTIEGMEILLKSELLDMQFSDFDEDFIKSECIRIVDENLQSQFSRTDFINNFELKYSVRIVR